MMMLRPVSTGGPPLCARGSRKCPTSLVKKGRARALKRVQAGLGPRQRKLLGGEDEPRSPEHDFCCVTPQTGVVPISRGSKLPPMLPWCVRRNSSPATGVDTDKAEPFDEKLCLCCPGAFGPRGRHSRCHDARRASGAGGLQRRELLKPFGDRHAETPRSCSSGVRSDRRRGRRLRL